MNPRQQAAELFEALEREEMGDFYQWHPDDGRAMSRYYPQVYEPEKVPHGKRRRRTVTPAVLEAIKRKVRAIRAAGTNGFRMHLSEFCAALGQPTGGSGRQAIAKTLAELEALDVVYTSEDQMWTGGV